MRKVYVHIGVQRTGTTALQLALHRARAPLHKQGLVYPGPSANHSELYLVFCDYPHLEHRNLRRNINTRALAKEQNERTVASLVQQLEESSQSSFLLSAEDFSHLSSEGVSRLNTFLRRFFDHVFVLCFVREPLSYALSMAQHAIFLGSTFDDLTKNPKLPYYENRLTPYIREFGRANVHILNYDRCCAEGRPLVTEMFDQFHIDVGDVEIPMTREKQSMTLEAATMFESLNRHRPVFIGNRRNLARTIVPLSWFESIGSTAFRMPVAWQRDVFEQTRRDALWLAEQFGIEFSDYAIDSQEDINSDPTFGQVMASHLADLLHRNAELIEASFREIYLLKSRLAEIQGDPAAAMSHLDDSLALDPFQPEVVEQRQRLNELSMAALGPAGHLNSGTQTHARKPATA